MFSYARLHLWCLCGEYLISAISTLYIVYNFFYIFFNENRKHFPPTWLGFTLSNV